MTRDRRLLLLLGLLMAYGLFVVECRYHQREDSTDATATEARHRHRHHRHESSNRRSHHDLDRRSRQEVDYEYDGDAEEDATAEDDYEMRSYYDHHRSHQQHEQKAYHGRMFEPRYPARYHGGGYHAGSWHDEDSDRREISPRYQPKNRRYGGSRSYHARAHSRDRDASDFDDDEDDDDDDDDDDTREDLDRSDRYVKDVATDRRRESWRNSRRRASPPRSEWKNRTSHGGRSNVWRHRPKDRVGDRETHQVFRWRDYWMKRSNSSDYKLDLYKDKSKSEDDEDYKDHGGLEESDKDDDDNDEEEEDEEDDNVWKIFDDKGEEDDEVEKTDNNFNKSKLKSALTYDDIIKKLTFNDPTTVKTTVKRDYRNIEDTHAKRESNRNPKYLSENVPKFLGPYTFPNRPLINRPHVSTALRSSIKSAVPDKRKIPRNALAIKPRNDWQQERRTLVKNDMHTKSKTDEPDIVRYTYPSEKEDDLDTTEDSEEEEEDMQADVTNTGYTDDVNGDEDENSGNITSRIISNITKMTSTTPKWPVNLNGKNTRPYERGTAAQYNGYQPKNDYPPMSAHSVYKWRTLGTRESVQQTRNNMQQYNKDGELTAMQEAILYWRKVHAEGSCKWPRAKLIRVSDSYPDSSVIYHPHCAILHECSDNTGCCQSDALTCGPKKSHPVVLTFWTTDVNNSLDVVKLKFYNHTECECQSKNEHNRILGMHGVNQYSPPQNIKRTPMTNSCRCPKHFTSRRRSLQGNCQCICQDNSDCMALTRGKRSFDHDDIMCISTNACTVPSCEFGTYVHGAGKCPARRDTINAAANHGMNFHRPYNSHRRNERRTREG